jgi:hypothetical protein
MISTVVIQCWRMDKHASTEKFLFNASPELTGFEHSNEENCKPKKQ